MIKINLSNPVIDLDGKAVEELTLGKLLGNQLAGSNKGEALKYYDWAVALYKGLEITTDKTDAKKIKEFVETTETLTNLVKAQIITILDSSIAADA